MDEAFELLWRLMIFTGRLMLHMVGVGVGAARTRRCKAAYDPPFLETVQDNVDEASGKAKRKRGKMPAVVPLKLSDATVYTVVLPRNTAWDAEKAAAFMNYMVGTFQRISFRILAVAGRIEWQILDLRLSLDPQMVARAIRAYYPDAEVRQGSVHRAAFNKPYFQTVLAWQQEVDFTRPLRHVEELRGFDPLIALSNALAELERGEAIAHTLIVCGMTPDANEIGKQMITTSDIHPLEYADLPTAIGAELRRRSGGDQVPLHEAAVQKVLEDKLNQPLYHALLLTEIRAPSHDRVRQLMAIGSHVWHFSKLPFNALVPGETSIIEIADEETQARADTFGLLDYWLTDEDHTWRENLLVLEHRELAALWHLPHQAYAASTMQWARARNVPMPREMQGQTEGICLGENVLPTGRVRIHMPDAERTTHTLMIGKTGTGKSTLLHRLIHQDIQAGRGVAVIDPKGDLVKDILEGSIYRERADDLVLLDFTQGDTPPPLNPLLTPRGSDRTLAAGTMMTIMEQLYPGFGGQMSDTLYNALLTLMYDERPTIRDVNRLFRDAGYRHSLIEKLDNVAAEDFWDSFNSLSTGQQQLLSQPIEHRMRSFYANPTLYSVMCHPQTLDFHQLMQQSKIILVPFALNTADAVIPPHEQRLLGSVLVTQLQLAALAGAAQRHGFTLYIDEAQNFITTSLHTLLTQARARNMALVLANQYLEQLAGNTLEAVMGSVGAIAAFEVDERDARALAPYFRPQFEPDDLVNLGKYRAALRMRYQHTPRVMTLTTLPPMRKPDNADERIQILRQHSASRFTSMTRSEVLAQLAGRYPKPQRQTATANGGDDGDWYDRG
jgi:hypothetical protein